MTRASRRLIIEDGTCGVKLLLRCLLRFVAGFAPARAGQAVAEGVWLVTSEALVTGL